MPKKKTGRIRNIKLTLFLSSHERNKLNHLLQQSKLSMSAFFRNCIHGTTIKAPPSREYKMLYTEINRVGQNINQIARRCHQGEDVLLLKDQLLFYMNELYTLLEENL